MSKEFTTRSVPVTNAKTGEVRMSAPTPVYVPRQSSETISMPAPATAEGQESGTIAPPQNENSAGAVETPQKDVGKAKASKAEIETLEQFIEYAYSRKGQRVTLKSKVEKQLAKNSRLDEAAQARLFSVAAADALLAVPRQLLLVSREVEGYPALRGALRSFVSALMLQHPVFADPEVHAALSNVPDAPSVDAILKKVAGYTPAVEEGKEALKPAELQALRGNAINLLAVWLANARGLGVSELAALLYKSMWLPAVLELSDDNARLRTLTEIEQVTAVGLACQQFVEEANEARRLQTHAQQSADEMSAKFAEVEKDRYQFEEQRDALQAELAALRDHSTEEMAELRRQHEVEGTHLRHDHDQLRGRLVRRLADNIEMLEVGLTALRNKTPRVEVMLERAEHVLEALQAELKNLKEE